MSVDSSLAQDPNYRSFFQQYAGCVKEEAATYSINQLKQYKEFVQRLYNDGVMVSSSGIDVLNNCYFINTWEKSENRTPYMLTAMASSAMPIRFETEEGICQTASSLYGGQGLTNEDSCTFSVGIGGTYNGQSAILTCGHKNGNINGRKQYISYSGTRIGQVVYQRCNTNPNNTSSSSLGDFSIVTLNSNGVATNKVKYSTGTVNITGTYSSVPVGTSIYKYGTNTGYSWGTVQYKNVKVSFKESGRIVSVIDGLYQSTMRNNSSTKFAVDNGDSGGPVYIKSGNSYLLHGIVTGGKAAVVGTGIMYSTPIYYAQDAGFTVKVS